MLAIYYFRAVALQLHVCSSIYIGHSKVEVCTQYCCFTIFAINVYDCPESEISKIPYVFVTLYLMSTFNLKGPKPLLNLLHL